MANISEIFSETNAQTHCCFIYANKSKEDQKQHDPYQKL